MGGDQVPEVTGQLVFFLLKKWGYLSMFSLGKECFSSENNPVRNSLTIP